jgi:signal transduction histidine kinase
MAVKEAMNNVLKHAGATEVRISLALAEGGLTFIVADNGRGFHLNGEHRTGDGLINMQKRLAQIGGRLVLESEPGRGTNVKMEAKAK